MKAPLQAGKSFGSAAISAPAQRKAGLKTIVDNRPSAIAQRKLQGVVQRLVYDKPNSTVYAPPAVMNLEKGKFAKYKEGLELILGQSGLDLKAKVSLQARVTTLRATSLKYAQKDTFDCLNLQFKNCNNVYIYNDDYTWVSPESIKPTPIMEPDDMGDDNPTPLKEGSVVKRYNKSDACVIQSLSDIGKLVPGGSKGSAEEHHRYCADEGLDYRTDSDYLKLYLNKHNLTLVHSGLTAWNAIDWKELGGAGNYVATTYASEPGASSIGHMIAIIVDGAFRPTIKDQQNLTKPALTKGEGFAKYIFKA